MKLVDIIKSLAWAVLLVSLLAGCNLIKSDQTSMPEEILSDSSISEQDESQISTPEGNVPDSNLSEQDGSQFSIPEGNLPDPYIFEHEEKIISAAISDDKKRFAAADDVDNILIWDLESKTLLKKWQSGGNFLMMFSPDGTQIAVCVLKENIQVWDIESETLVLEIPYKCFDTIQYSPDGKMIVAGSKADVIKAWDSTSGEELFSIPKTVEGIDLNHDGSMMAFGETSRTIHIWDMEAGEDILTFRGTTQILNLTFSPDEKTLATHYQDTITFYNVENGEVLFELSPETENYRIYDIKFDPSGDYLIVVYNNDKVEVWDLEKREVFSSFVSEFPIQFYSVNLSQDGSVLLITGFSQTGFAHLWEFDQ